MSEEYNGTCPYTGGICTHDLELGEECTPDCEIYAEQIGVNLERHERVLESEEHDLLSLLRKF